MRELLICALLCAMLLPLAAEDWRQPDEETMRLFNARRTPSASLFPEHGKILFWERPGYMPLQMLAWPQVRLGGLDITTANNGEARSGYITNPWLLDVATGDSLRLPMPEGAFCGSETAAPDGHAFVFNQYSRDNITLWRYDLATGKLRPLVEGGINQVLGDSFQWMPDSRHLLVRLVDDSRGAPPQESLVPAGPTVYETTGQQKQLRTYPNLLSCDYDEAQFRYYVTTQFALVDSRNGRLRKLGQPGLYRWISPSPDGEYFLVRRLDELSRRIPWWGFANSYELWDAHGNLLQTLVRQPNSENVPNGGVLTGARGLHWDPCLPHTLVWAETQDGGDPKNEVLYRDFLYTRDVEQDEPVLLRMQVQRYNGIDYISPSEYVFRDYDRDRKWKTATYVNTATGVEQLIEDVSSQDMYNRPGEIIPELRHQDRARKRGGGVFLACHGFSPEGTYPFIEQLDLTTFEKTSLWQSERNRYERPVYFWDENTLAIWSESPTEPPNVYLQDIASGKKTPLTHFVDDAAVLSSLPKRLETYPRDDGLPLSGMLYLPPDWDGHTRLPLVIDAYPVEYVSQETAGQDRNVENVYTRVWGSSPLYLCLQGYAVLTNAKIAVVGDPETVNETFLEQAVSSAEAAISHLDSIGVVDPNRVAVMGHSYGAFMVVNLLAHSDLFAAGIAKNGAYNRTLTPFGFQKERRTLWEATDLYLDVSPFLHAQDISAPLLLIHSQNDSNPGTFPLQSERLYEALDGLGKNCRYLELPLEEHGYRAKETHLHLLVEFQEFLDKYLKD